MNEANTHVSLDAADLRLLAVLQEDASLSNQALAEKCSLSPATCMRRVRRLRASGVIQAQVALLSPQHLGAGLTAIVEISLDAQGAEHLQRFEARAVAHAEVQQCYRVSPGPDFVLILQVVDMGAYHALVQQLLTQDANVRHVKTYFSVHRAKFHPRLALPKANAFTA